MARTSAATSTPSTEDVEALRAPLTGYCYRMLGGAADTDDAVQETIIRAVRHLDRFDPARAKLTTWTHRIATTVCLDMLRSATRRALPLDLGPGAEGGELGAPLPPETFVEPMPDSRVLATDPGDVIVQSESVRLAFIAALQQLTPRQRAALVLRDVLAFSARETAEVLETSVAAANSALQRARATLAEHRNETTAAAPLEEPAQQHLVERYIAAFEAHDVDALRRVLHDDAVTSMPPFVWHVRGGPQIARMITENDACAHDRMLPTAINGVAGIGQYRPDETGELRPFALVAVGPRDGLVGSTITFLGTGDRFAEFGLPTSLGSVR